MTTYHSIQDEQSSNTEESSQDAAPRPVSPSEVPADDREATQLELQPLLDPDDPRVSPLKLERNTIIQSYCHNIGLRKLGAFCGIIGKSVLCHPRIQ